ncbi:hypothetical protein DL89DRAFT_258874 [Linderina pennispora]|uniref:Uncharacterized protein n=1 Tax=Linderina pennispora TaxID=61395 RepID=A0A1Y1W406_9FUNG|nr:uncharacterized protein DL89DRAFT_258874 [Linderina pennispora]ORX68303.1 hypothetical protein DL89DRAFT_258874 [Linderina pennispora]
MYDYVRRQQEAHSQLFSSKTFRWVDSGLHEASWVKVYNRRTSGEPLANALAASQHISTAMTGRQLQHPASTQQPQRKLFSLGGTRRHSNRGSVLAAPSSPPGRPSRSTIGSPDVVREAKRRRRGYTQSTMGSQQGLAAEQPLEAAASIPRQRAPTGSQNSMLGPGIFIDGSSSLHHSMYSLSSASTANHPQRRTICYHARSFLLRVRRMRANRRQPPSFTVLGSRAITSVSRANDDEALGKIIQREHARRRLTPRDPLSIRHRTLVPGRPSASTLAKSPLSRAMSITDGEPSEDEGERPPPANAQRKSLATSDISDSSEEDVIMCLVCERHEGADWTVHCAATHTLCFSCVQSHVKHALQAAATAVTCPVSQCTAAISQPSLRKCLPPQRFDQLLAAQHRPPPQTTQTASTTAKESVSSIIRRSLSRSRKRANSTSQQPPQSSRPNSLDGAEQFDVPIIRVETRASQDSSAIATPAPSTARLSTLHEEDSAASRHSLADSTAGIDELQQSLGHLSLATKNDDQAADPPQPPQPLVSEFTSIEPVEGTSLSDLTLSPDPDSRLRRVPKAQHNMRAENTPPQPPQSPTSALFDYADMELDSYMRPSDSAAESNPPPAAPRPLSFIPANPAVPPPVPPSLPFEFRASATWITPEQRYSGFAENLMLNAALFDTIRRESNPSSDSEGESATNRPSKYPSQPPSGELPPSKDDEGVYIPTWRSKEHRRHSPMPLWADSDYGSDAAILSEAAELNFDLYESLHSLR